MEKRKNLSQHFVETVRVIGKLFNFELLTEYEYGTQN